MSFSNSLILIYLKVNLDSQKNLQMPTENHYYNNNNYIYFLLNFVIVYLINDVKFVAIHMLIVYMVKQDLF